MSEPPILEIHDLGRRDYGEVWELQRQLVCERARDERPDTLILVEHPHVITIGRRAGAARHVLDAGEVPVFEVERGGDATYHGPGQLVGYPIIKLTGAERDLHWFLRRLEEALVLAIARVPGVRASRREGMTGVWIGEQKVASIGVAVRDWVTFHGFALNLQPDLTYFRRLMPCGMSPEVMSSLAAILGQPIDAGRMRGAVAQTVAQVLGRRLGVETMRVQ